MSRSAALLALLASPALADTLHVGPGQTYSRIEPALAAAKPGDTITVHFTQGGYDHAALLIRTPRLTLRAASNDPRIELKGDGFDYSGAGSVPRAIVQFDPQAVGCTVEGFELRGARNGSQNGSGIRINQADHITIRNCTIHDCDMGIMTNGGRGGSAADQRIEHCLIFGNGAPAEPGFSHNLYLGGTSAVISGCEIRGSTAGHNLKSRAHYTRIEYCWIHDSANREIDLVDAAGDTDRPGSDAVLLCNIIAKSPECRGNRGVIHFGQDGGHDHTGTIYLVNNTVVTPYISPVLDLSSPGAHARLVNNIITDAGAGQPHQALVALAAPISRIGDAAMPPRITGNANFVSAHFEDAASIGAEIAPDAAPLTFNDPATGDFRFARPFPSLTGRGQAIASLSLPPAPGRPDDDVGSPLLQYLHPQRTRARGDTSAPDLGALGPRP